MTMRIPVAIGMLAALLCAVAAAPARAANDPPSPTFSVDLAESTVEERDPNAPKSGEGSKSAEKANVLQQMGLKRYDLGIYTLVVFVLLLLVLSKLAWNPIIEGMDKREAFFKSAKEQAERALAETAALRAELEASKVKAAEDVKAMMDEARRDAEVLGEKLKSDAAAEIAAERDRLRREIDSARDQALADIWNQSVTLASLISAKTVRKQLTADDHRALLDESLGELKLKLKKAG